MPTTPSPSLQYRHNLRPATLDALSDKYRLNDTMEQFDRTIVNGTDVTRGNFLRNQTNEERQRIIVKIQERCTEGFIWGLIGGSYGGAAVGSILGGIISGPPGAFLGGSIGLVSGSAAGTTIGAAVGAAIQYVEIDKDNTYIIWKTACIDRNKYNAYKEKIKLIFPSCEDFICPISNDFPLIPVVSPNRHVYDYETITAWLNHKTEEERQLVASFSEQACLGCIRSAIDTARMNVCPMRGPYFTKEQLLYSYEFVTNLRNKLENYLQNQHCENRDPEVVAGLNAYLNTINSNSRMILVQRINAVSRRMDHMGLTNEKFRESVFSQVIN